MPKPSAVTVTMTVTSRQLDILDAALSYAFSNLDDANDALDSDFQEHEVDDLREMLQQLAVGEAE